MQSVATASKRLQGVASSLAAGSMNQLHGLADRDVTYPDGQTTLGAFLGDQQLCQSLTLVLNGSDLLNRTLLIEELMASSSGVFLITGVTGVDALRGVQNVLQPGHVLLCDQLDRNITDQLIRINSHPAVQTRVRAPFRDIVLPAGLRVVILTDMYGNHSEPPVRRRIAVCNVA